MSQSINVFPKILDNEELELKIYVEEYTDFLESNQVYTFKFGKGSLSMFEHNFKNAKKKEKELEIND